MTPADLRAFLDHMGWSDREAARRIGCSRTSLTTWLNGRPIPPYIALACAALAFGLPPWRSAAKSFSDA